MTVPVRLDSLVFPRFRASTVDDARTEGSSADVGESERQFLFGVWLVATVVTGVAFLLVDLAVDAWPLGILGALVTAVPGSMALLRGVVDAVSPRGKLPKHATSTATWLVCYLVATGALIVAFVA